MSLLVQPFCSFYTPKVLYFCSIFKQVIILAKENNNNYSAIVKIKWR